MSIVEMVNNIAHKGLRPSIIHNSTSGIEIFLLFFSTVLQFLLKKTYQEICNNITEICNKKDHISCCDSKFHATQRSSDNKFIFGVTTRNVVFLIAYICTNRSLLLYHRALLRPVKITTSCIWKKLYFL